MWWGAMRSSPIWPDGQDRARDTRDYHGAERAAVARRGTHMPISATTLALCLIAALGVVPTPAVDAGDARPNIVVVMLDDLHAGPAERLFQRSPTIKERFLDHGIRFTRAFGETPLCCPGRAGFLSGRHTHNHGVVSNHPAGFDQSRTLATALHDAGYWTAWVGKYFNNATELVLPPPGWDAFEHASPSGETKHEWLAARAPKILARASPHKPIFAVVSSSAPHNATGSYLPRSTTYAGDPRCSGVGRWAPPSYNEADVSDKPLYTRKRELLPYAKGWPLLRHCEQILWVDETVHRVEVELDRQDRLRNTLWLLVGDNGMTYGEHRWPFKLSPYSAQIPLWASWPAGRGMRPRDEAALISNIDLGPSLSALGGASMPWADGTDHGPLFLDERAVAPNLSLLLSLPEGHPRSAMNMPPVPAWWGVRSADEWLYVEWATGETELYDLKVDPWLLDNRASDPAYAPRAAAMHRRLVRHREDR